MNEKDDMKLPEGWKVIKHKPGWHFGVLGRYNRSTKTINIYTPIWVPKIFGLRDFCVKAIYEHEAYHAWGHEGCSTPYCLMFEDNEGWREVLAYPGQLFHGFKLCKRCSDREEE